MSSRADVSRESVPGWTPVLVGGGTASQRTQDPASAAEPLELMYRAAVSAVEDDAGAAVLREVDRIYVPKGRWRYRDPGRALAARIGAPEASSILARVGVLQQGLIGHACAAIADGELRAALVVGGEAGNRIAKARAAGLELEEVQQNTSAEAWSADEPLMTEAEAPLGQNAVGFYAVIDSSYRRRHGIALDAHRDAIGERYSMLSKVAASNPHAWKRDPMDPGAIRNPSNANPILAFPYTKVMAAYWSVDQASALLLCSAAVARKAGIPTDRWVFPLASATSNHMVPLTERQDMGRCPGAELAAGATLDHAGMKLRDLDLVELYSCFPVAQLVHAEALGLPTIGHPLSVIGGMPFAGGPFNNYPLHATAQIAARLRKGEGTTALISSVSGVLTKHAFGLWSTEPLVDFADIDVTDEAAAATERADVRFGGTGSGTVAGYTVMPDHHHEPARVVAVVDLADGKRTVATTDDPALVTEVMATDLVGSTVEISEGRLQRAATGRRQDGG